MWLCFTTVPAKTSTASPKHICVKPHYHQQKTWNIQSKIGSSAVCTFFMGRKSWKHNIDVLSTVQLHKKVDVGETRDHFQQSWNGCTSVSLLCSPKVQAWLIIISGVYSSGTQGHLFCSICCSDGQCNQLKNWGLSSSLGCLVPQGWDIIHPNIISDPTQQIESPWNNLVAKPVNISDI